MACTLLTYEVRDLTLGKPSLPWLSSSASVGDALKALKYGSSHGAAEMSIWDCVPSSHLLYVPAGGAPALPDSPSEGAIIPSQRGKAAHCRCIGKVSMLGLLCFLASDESLCNPAKALRSPLKLLASDTQAAVHHIDANASLLDALELVAMGAQNLVVPIDSEPWQRPSSGGSHVSRHNGHSYCWLTQEDVIRFLLGFIGTFSPIPSMTIDQLGLVNSAVPLVGANQDLASVLDVIKRACYSGLAVAVTEEDEEEEEGSGGIRLVGEISSSFLKRCDESAALSLATLSAKDFLLFTQDCQNPPDSLVKLVRARIYQKAAMLQGNPNPNPNPSRILKPEAEAENTEEEAEAEEVLGESSSDDDMPPTALPRGPLAMWRTWKDLGAVSNRPAQSHHRFSYPVSSFHLTCRPTSSLMAVLVQALAHRESHIWVAHGDGTLAGLITFQDIIGVLLSHLSSFSS